MRTYMARWAGILGVALVGCGCSSDSGPRRSEPGLGGGAGVSGAAGGDRVGAAGHGGNSASRAAGGGAGQGGGAGDGSSGAPAGGESGAASGRPTHLPSATEPCPRLESGMLNILGVDVSLAVGPAGAPGPVLFFWHATGMTYAEVELGFGDAIAEVEAGGGLVASFTSTNGEGRDTGNGVWYTGDIDVADEILACALEQGLADARRVHVSGYSSGGLQCAAMTYLRSGYVASALCLSGGLAAGDVYPLQDPAHIPAVMVAHGALGSDFVGIDFAEASARFTSQVVRLGGLAIECDDGGDHIASGESRSRTMGPIGWRFFAEQPYGGGDRYASGLPEYFPEYCARVE